jgi:hypothetical protein
VALFIDQNTDDLYCAYLGNEDGSESYLATLTAFYKKSTDGAATWDSQAAYQQDAADDEIYIAAGHSTAGRAAGRFEPVFFNDDLNDLYVNAANSVTLAAASTATPDHAHIRISLGARPQELPRMVAATLRRAEQAQVE